MDERFEQAINKIVQLASQQPEFKEALLKKLEINSSTKPFSDHSSSIIRIEKYLGLDYGIDNKESIIDYSFIPDEEIQNILSVDNREMLRYRYGARYHVVDFVEFCRFAQMQAEMMLNFYYDYKNDSDISRIKIYIMKFNTNPSIILDSYSSITSIPYNIKLYAFRTESNMPYSVFEIMNNIRKARNEISHRSKRTDEIDVADFREKLLSQNMPLKDNGLIDWYKIKDNPVYVDIYKNTIEKSNEYTYYRYCLWYNRKDFNEVIISLKYLANSVESLL